MNVFELTAPSMFALADFQKALDRAEQLKNWAPLSQHDAEDFLKAVGVWRLETADMLANNFERQTVKDSFLKRSAFKMPNDLPERVEFGQRVILFGIRTLNALGTQYIDPNFKTFALAVPEAEGAPQLDRSGEMRRVFVVHGHGQYKDEVARVLQRLDLDPVILQEQPSAGDTVIDKLERHSAVGYAVVIAAPDDVGSKAGAAEPRTRARQNVIFELGYFVGKLGRGRVCLLSFPDVEIPSDFLGVVYVPYDQHGGWRLQLARELRSAGIFVDLNRL